MNPVPVLYALKKTLHTTNLEIIRDMINPSLKTFNMLNIRLHKLLMDKAFHGSSTKFRSLSDEVKKMKDDSLFGVGLVSGYQNIIGQFMNATNLAHRTVSMTNWNYLIQQSPAILKSKENSIGINFRGSDHFIEGLEKWAYKVLFEEQRVGVDASTVDEEETTSFFTVFPSGITHYVIDVPALQMILYPQASDKTLDDYCRRFWTAAKTLIFKDALMVEVDGRVTPCEVLHLCLNADLVALSRSVFTQCRHLR